VLEGEREDELRYYRYFSTGRGLIVPVWLEKVLGKRQVFRMNNAWAKYYQRDVGREVPIKTS